MAKISDFGNTWGKFFCRGETHAVHLAWPPSPLHVKKRSKWHHLQKIFSARGSSSSFSPFTLKCPNSSFLETNFENFLLMHSAQHSLQRVLSSYRQFSFPLPLHIYMAKISDFGNTWGNFLPGRNSRCTFSQTPLTPTWEKSGKLTPPPEKFFQHVSHHLMSKNELFGNLFRIVISNCSARVSIVIDHPCEFCQHHLLSAGPYCPLSLYVKIEAEWKHFLKIFW